MQKPAAIAAAATVVTGLAAGAFFVFAGSSGDQFAECRITQIASGGSELGDAFTLVSETGETVTRTDVVDRLSLIYFGYTYCPDVCPLDAARNAEITDMLASAGIEMKPVFITIDPDRDDVESMRDFTDNLHPDMLGLTGSQAQIEAAKSSFRAYGARIGDGEDYLMDHSTFSYLMAPEQGLLEVIRRDVSAESAAETISCFSAKI